MEKSVQNSDSNARYNHKKKKGKNNVIGSADKS